MLQYTEMEILFFFILLLYRLPVKDCRGYIVMYCFVSAFSKLIGSSTKPNRNFVGDL